MASYTENLNLLKKNPLTDGSDTFNIETMLNENWDKIDAFAGVAANPAELWVWEKQNASTLAHIGYVASPSSTAYPTDGTSGGYRYTRLGQIGGAARIEIGSYVGTGTYGSSNPTSVTFDFKPKIIFWLLSSNITSEYFLGSRLYSNVITPIEFFTTEYKAYKQPYLYYEKPSNGYAKISEDGKTISWYNTESASRQNNTSYEKYYYVAIG